MDKIRVTADADSRSVLTSAIDQAALEQITRGWTVPAAMPAGALRLWERAVGQFRSGTFAYENFTDAVRTGFEAVDAALRSHASEILQDGRRRTFGPLIEYANKHGKLTPHQYEWLCEYALRFRNQLTHSDGREPLVLSPPMASDMLGGIARFLSNLLDDTAS